MTAPNYYWTWNEQDAGDWYYRRPDDGHVLCAIVSWDSLTQRWVTSYSYNYNGATSAEYATADAAKDAVETIINASWSEG